VESAIFGENDVYTATLSLTSEIEAAKKEREVKGLCQLEGYRDIWEHLEICGNMWKEVKIWEKIGKEGRRDGSFKIR
jgi:hypothetical protein